MRRPKRASVSDEIAGGRGPTGRPPVRTSAVGPESGEGFENGNSHTLAARERQAAELGGEVVAARGLDLASGMSGPELRLEAAGHPMTVSTVSSRTGSHGGRSAETHAQVAFGSDDLIGFQVLAHGHPVRAIGGLQGMLLRKSLADALKRAKTDAERRSIESVQFLSESAVTTLPTEIAELCELRSNDPARAVQLLGAPGVPGALRELDRLVRAWEWTLYPAKLPGRMELTVNRPGGCSDTEVIRTVRTLQTAALEALGEAKAA